ncbi:hypothetical protein [Streptomyces sp. cg40]|uniref:hypothetical protein n=1 Tax=Streptomyces sp. cg40 TaxID=3419764 RepID=UPI003D087826
MTDRDPRIQAEGRCKDDLDMLLATTHTQLGTAISDRINAHGGPPELRTPDLALDRLLAATHRSIGSAVACRHSREARAAQAQRDLALEARLAERGPLANRPSSVRVKYRQEALRLARRYWPSDLAEGMRAAVRLVHNLIYLLENPSQPVADVDAVVEQLREHLDAMARLPEPKRAPVTLTGLDYLVAVEWVLADPAERLMHDLHRIRQLLDEELAPAIDTLTSPPADLFGVDAVAQDLVDDLIQGCEQANALAKAVGEVERASSDFVGADLSDAKLEGVLLEGILWDAATIWPGGWESLVRRASLPSTEDQGVLVIAAEPSSTMLHVEA